MKTVCICGWCWSTIKDVTPLKILHGMKDKDRCDLCGRLCYGYVCADGKEEAGEEDNERRPGNFKREVS